MTLILEIVIGLVVGVILMLLVVGLLELRYDTNHEAKSLDKKEKDHHMRHLARKNEKRTR